MKMLTLEDAIAAVTLLIVNDDVPEFVWSDKVIENLKSAPSLQDAEPVRHGRWEEDKTTYAGPGLANMRCSNCKRIGGTWRRGLAKTDMYWYCPWCGEKMDGVTDV